MKRRVVCLFAFLSYFHTILPVAAELNVFADALNGLADALTQEKDVYHVGDKTIKLIVGDLMAQKNIDVLVNAANDDCTKIGTGGVAGVIRAAFVDKDRFGGFSNQIETKYAGQLSPKHKGQPGQAYLGDLPKMPEAYVAGKDLYQRGYKYLVNAVGPRCNGGENVNLVADAYKNSLSESEKVGATSILFPRISSGIFGCPQNVIDKLAIQAVVSYLRDHPDGAIKTVYFIFYDQNDDDMSALKHYRTLLDTYIK